MKTLIALSMVLASSLSFAKIDRVIPNDEAIDVLSAVVMSLESHDLDCKSTVGSASVAKASEFNWNGIIQAMSLSSRSSIYKVEVSDDLSQPVISLTISKDNSNVEVTKLTTNAEMTLVTNVSYVSKYTTKTSTRVNTGTIINPKFETRTEVKETILNKIDCE
ncbi:hypothetical protein ACJVC5_14490 [Peredibacter sp. HCB2-198]|uniref:hypothetical protein n=1 Tax=Peredibacter sp. HCB2-198 TaxID=3383025 RepID=UPI0038B468E6